MTTESPTEYGPHFPDKEQIQAVLNDPDQAIEGIENTMRLYIDEQQRQLEAMNAPRIERMLLDVDIAIMQIEAGFLSLARDCYYATYDILELDQALTEDEEIKIAAKLRVLEDKIADYIEASEK